MIGYEEFRDMAAADAARSQEDVGGAYDLPWRHPDAFIAAWVTGGRLCRFDGDPGETRTAQPEPEIEPLLELLDDLGLKRRQVNTVKAQLRRGSHIEQLDHNGSQTEYDYKVITIDALHAKLAELGVVEARTAPAP